MVDQTRSNFVTAQELQEIYGIGLSDPEQFDRWAGMGRGVCEADETFLDLEELCQKRLCRKVNP